MAIPLVIAIIGDTTKLAAGLGTAGKQVSAFGRTIDVGGVAKMAAFAGGAAIVVTGLLELADAAAQDVAEAAALEQAVTAAGGAIGSWKTDIDEAIAAGQALAFTDTQIRDALTPLVGVLGSVEAATGSLALAEDLARLKKIDLSVAAAAVAKAEAGQGAALAKLVGGMESGLSSTEILAEAQRRAAGQAKTYGASTAGAAERNGIAMAEMGESIGALLLPVLDALVPALLPVISALTEIMAAILPVLIPLFSRVGSVLGVVGGVIARVARAIADLIGWLSDAIATVGDFVASLGPVQAIGDLLGNLFGPGILGGPGGGGTGGGTTAGPGNALTIHVNGGDPEAVVRAIVRWTGSNGGWPALERRVRGG